MFDIILTFGLGFFAGGLFGFLIAAVCVAARRGDEQ